MLKGTRDDAVFDALLGKALEEAALEEIAELKKAEAPEIEFSAKHRREQRRAYKELTRRKQKPAWVKYAVRAVACFLIICVLGCGIALSVPTVRADFMKLIAKPFEKYTSFGTVTDSIFENNDYVFEYIPEGFELVKYVDDVWKEFKYDNTNDETYFVIKFSPGNDVSLQRDSEDTKITNITINGEIAYLFKKIEDNSIHIVYSNGVDSFHVFGNISEKLIVKIANNINNYG